MIRLALAQVISSADKAANLAMVEDQIARAAGAGAPAVPPPPPDPSGGVTAKDLPNSSEPLS